MSDTAAQLLELGPAPAPRGRLLRDVVAHRDVLLALARKDFQTRYKRATFGVLWAVAVPVLQASVMAVVFSKLVRFDTDDYAAFLMTGIVAWSYFAGTLTASSTSIVENASLTEKVWFPRALLPAVTPIANLVGLVISTLVVIVISAFFGVVPGPELLVLLPALALAFGFTVALSEVLAALHVYFRDVRYLVQAALLVWMYVTPVIFPPDFAPIARYRWVFDSNPLTGVVALFRLAILGTSPGWERPVLVAVVATAALLVVSLEVHRRHDRLFADQL